MSVIRYHRAIHPDLPGSTPIFVIVLQTDFYHFTELVLKITKMGVLQITDDYVIIMPCIEVLLYKV
jgi:hypothetical protein